MCVHVCARMHVRVLGAVDTEGFTLAVATAVREFGVGVGIVGAARFEQKALNLDPKPGQEWQGEAQERRAALVVLPVAFVDTMCSSVDAGDNGREASEGGALEELVARMQAAGARVTDVSALPVGVLLGKATSRSELGALGQAKARSVPSGMPAASDTTRWTGGSDGFERALGGAVGRADAVLRVCSR